MKKIYLLILLITAGTNAWCQQQNPQATFTPGNLVIYRVGDGSAALSSAATPVFLDEYTPAGVLIQSIPLPTTVSGSNRAITSAGTSTSEGMITRSTDKQYLLATGYDAAVGTLAVAGTAGTTVNRVIGRIGYDGSVNSTTALTDFATLSNPRSATSPNGTDLWGVGGAGGIRYTTLGVITNTSTQLSTTVTTLRVTNIFNGQLYVSAQSGAFRLATVGSGTPTTTGQIITNLPGFPTATGSPYSFFFADLDAGTPGVDVVYVADDGAAIGFQKYSLVAGSWVANGNIPITANNLRGLTATVVAGTGVILYGTSPAGLFTYTDATGYNGTLPVTPALTSIAVPGTNKAFRGVAFTPENLTPLPLQLVNVKAYQQNSGVKIEWSNLTETNINAYSVERSIDGRTFTSITTQNAKANNNRQANYDFTDASPVNGINYYRIKSLQTSGSILYSDVLKVNISQHGSADITVYPNPAKGNKVSLQLSNVPAANYNVKLFAVDGRLLFETSLNHAGGSSSQTLLLPATINKGVYNVNVTNGSLNFIKKIIVE